eukprot:scaffold9009_cov130-Isochrysis_galbana.AAC.5
MFEVAELGHPPCERGVHLNDAAPDLPNEPSAGRKGGALLARLRLQPGSGLVHDEMTGHPCPCDVQTPPTPCRTLERPMRCYLSSRTFISTSQKPC